MRLDQLIPVVFMIAILVLVLPGFFRSNSKSKQLLNNLFIWSIIILCVMVVSNFIFK